MSADTTGAPVLEDLQKSQYPAVLWDTERCRIVWSNRVGLTFFGAETLFDLIDRQFTTAEHGVARIVELGAELEPETISNEVLIFPSAGLAGTIYCNCRVHNLLGGRSGILLIGQRSGQGDPALPSDRDILDALPQALMVASPVGEILSSNKAAAALFGETDSGNLAVAFQNEDLAKHLIQRTIAAGSLSLVERLPVQYGQRDIRLHSQLLGDRDARQILLIMEDVTDRRVLEKRLREHAEHLSDFIACAADFTWELNAEQTFSDVSESFLTVTGLAVETVMGATWQEVSRQHGLDPDGQIVKLMQEHSAWKAEVNIKPDAAQNRAVRLVLSAVPVFVPDGTFAGYRGIGAAAPEEERAPQGTDTPPLALINQDVPKENQNTALLEENEAKQLSADVQPAEVEAVEEAFEQIVASDEIEETMPEMREDALSEEEKVTFVEIGKTLTREALGEPSEAEKAEDEQSDALPEQAEETNVSEQASTLMDTGSMPASEEKIPDAALVNNSAEAETDDDESNDPFDQAITAVENIIDGLPDAIAVHRAGKLLHLNTFASALLGLESPEQALESEELRSLLGVYADDLSEPGAGAVTFTSAPYESGSVRLTAHATAIAWPDGEAVQITLKPAAASGDDEPELGLPENVVHLVRDEIAGGQVTPCGPSNADLLAMLNTATDGILTLDHEGKVISLNSSAEAMFGYETEEVTGRSLGEFLNRSSQDIFERYMAVVSDAGIGSILNDGREATGIEKNGGEIPLFLTLGSLDGKDDGAQACRYCAVLRDMTSWKKTEAELVEAREAAELASAQKSEFLANISHEIRTPLNAILGFSEIMKARRFGEIDNAKYSGYVNDIHSSGEHLLSLINDLLDLSKVEAGKLDLNFTSVDLGEVIMHSIGLMEQSARDARVIVRNSVQEGLPNVVADQRSMRQIMLNLLSNAIKFTDAGGQVVISARLEAEGQVSLKIKDTGRGMTEEQVARAMEPFRQVEEVAVEDAPGTGLGLPLTKALAEANRSSFNISSEPQVGTVVEIMFPTTRVLAE